MIIYIIMKQLKIVVDNYDNVGGLINVSFNQEIYIEPKSEIAMDKFSMQVTNGLTDNFELPNQTVLINTNYDDESMPPARGAIIPAGKYVNISALLNQMNQSFNSILISDLLYTANTTRDNGLFFRSWIPSVGTPPLVHIGYGSNALDYTNANYAITNMTFTSSGATTNTWNINEGEYSMETNSTTPIIAGALDIRFSMSLPSLDATNEFTYGITLDGVVKFGFEKVGTEMYVINNGQAEVIDSEPFVSHATYTHQFFVTQGTLSYQIITAGGSPSRVYLKEFDGFDFSQVCGFKISGTYTETAPGVIWTNLGVIFQPNLSVNTFGVSWNYDSFVSPEYLSLFPLQGVAPSRVVELDFASGQVLQAGLGFVGTKFDIGNGNPTTTNNVTANQTFGFSDYYDIALQIPSLQIESYIASGDRKNGGRINNICYFVPLQTQGTTSTIYTYDNKELVFVSISNRERVNMNSMQFRVVYSNDPTGRTFINCDSLSFNLYIKEPPSL
jgi:hypothetical protein